MSEPVRVLWLVKGLGRGGVERLVVSSLKHLDRTRFAVEVAYVMPQKDALVRELRDLGVPVHCLGRRTRVDATWPWRLRRLVAEGRFDIVHTHMPLTAAVARLVVPRSTRLIHTEHNVWAQHHRLTRLANRLTIAHNAAVLAVSETVAASIHGLSRRRRPQVQVVIHGPDLAEVRDRLAGRAWARASMGLPDACFVVGTVGNLTPKKGHRTLVDAFARIAVDDPTARLVLVGAGPLEAELRRRVAECGLTERTVFTGSRDDVPALLPGFDVFCLSSVHEGLSIALLEAMATGVAPVCTAAGGVVEVIEPGVSGLLVPTGDPDALAAAIGDVARDPELRARLGEGGRRRSTRFDLVAAVRQLEQVYERVLAGAQGGAP